MKLSQFSSRKYAMNGSVLWQMVRHALLFLIPDHCHNANTVCRTSPNAPNDYSNAIANFQMNIQAD
jgi:hypothetical protein